MTIIEAFEKVKKLPTEVWWRVLSYMFTSIIVIPNISNLLFLIYMHENSFLSFDFFKMLGFEKNILLLSVYILILFLALPILCLTLLAKAVTIDRKQSRRSTPEHDNIPPNSLYSQWISACSWYISARNKFYSRSEPFPFFIPMCLLFLSTYFSFSGNNNFIKRKERDRHQWNKRTNETKGQAST